MESASRTCMWARARKRRFGSSFRAFCVDRALASRVYRRDVDSTMNERPGRHCFAVDGGVLQGNPPTQKLTLLDWQSPIRVGGASGRLIRSCLEAAVCCAKDLERGQTDEGTQMDEITGAMPCISRPSIGRLGPTPRGTVSRAPSARPAARKEHAPQHHLRRRNAAPSRSSP